MPGWYDDGSEEEYQMRQAARKTEKALERELASREGENIEDNADVRMVRPLDRDVLGSEEADALSVSTANAGTTNNLLEPAERPEQTHTPLPWNADGIHVQGAIQVHHCADGSPHEYRKHFALGGGWASLEQRRIDAQFIVTACNNYEAMKKSHAALVEIVNSLRNRYDSDMIVENSEDDLMFNKVYATLANAKALMENL